MDESRGVRRSNIRLRVGARRREYLTKRILDIVIAVPLLVMLAPVMALVAVCITLDDRKGGIFYRSRRVGRAGREFPMLKFRKMRDGAIGPALTAASDERFTRIGSFLARTKLDELPQLVNVIRGDMSLVGPRPEDPLFVALNPDGFADVLRSKPGVTGLTQLAFAKESRLLNRPDRVEFYVAHLLAQKASIDRLYTAQRSVAMDLRILAWTALAVFTGVDVSVDRRSGALSVRRRPPPQPDTATPVATEEVNA